MSFCNRRSHDHDHDRDCHRDCDRCGFPGAILIESQSRFLDVPMKCINVRCGISGCCNFCNDECECECNRGCACGIDCSRNCCCDDDHDHHDDHDRDCHRNRDHDRDRFRNRECICH